MNHKLDGVTAEGEVSVSISHSSTCVLGVSIPQARGPDSCVREASATAQNRLASQDWAVPSLHPLAGAFHSRSSLRTLPASERVSLWGEHPPEVKWRVPKAKPVTPLPSPARPGLDGCPERPGEAWYLPGEGTVDAQAPQPSVGRAAEPGVHHPQLLSKEGMWTNQNW